MRERTYTWGHPSVTAAAVRDLAGIDIMRAVMDGSMPRPPIADSLGFDLVRVEPGVVEFTLEPEEFHYNPIGSVHGGVYATLLDSAAGCAVHTLLPVGVGYTSLDLSAKFLRP